MGHKCIDVCERSQVDKRGSKACLASFGVPDGCRERKEGDREWKKKSKT